MNKQTLIKRLAAGGKVLLTSGEAAKALGIRREYLNRIMSGTEYLPSGNTRRYLIDDIAEAVMQRTAV